MKFRKNHLFSFFSSLQNPLGLRLFVFIFEQVLAGFQLREFEHVREKRPWEPLRPNLCSQTESENLKCIHLLITYFRKLVSRKNVTKNDFHRS